MRRNQRGVQIVELVCGSIVLIPIVLYGIDIATVYFGASMNSNICRDACRAAAAGPPQGYALPAYGPIVCARRVVREQYREGAIIRVNPTEIEVTQNIQEPRPVAPWGGPIRGDIQVKTQVHVFPPFLLPAVSKEVVLKTDSKFPITWVMPANYIGNPVKIKDPPKPGDPPALPPDPPDQPPKDPPPKFLP